MPNNSSARREKGEKKKDKNKKTDPPPLHKGDNGSTDSSSSSLSLSGKDKVSMDSFCLSYAGKYMEALEAELLVPGRAQSAFVLGYSRSLPEEESISMHVALREAHPKVLALELTTLKRSLHLKKGLKALKKWR